MSCREELEFAEQSIVYAQQGLAELRVQIGATRAQISMYRAAQEANAPLGAVSQPGDLVGRATGDNAITVETRPGRGAASEAALHRDLTDMETRLDKLEAR